MFGFHEILIVAAIILGIIFLPSLLRKRQKPQVQRPIKPMIRLSGKMRMAVAASVIYPALASFYFQPWQKEPLLFFYIGIGPVVLGWLLRWVFKGFGRR
ncbi:hypothetical protein ACFLZL_01640 [Thermodesulfobacteriota bacterium]